MKILLIITPFHPAQDPNTLRWSALMGQFKSQGHSIDVLTTLRHPLPKFDDNNLIRIHRTGYHTLLDRLYNLLGSKTRRHEPGYKPKAFVQRSSVIQTLIDHSWRKFYWPDGQMLFLKPGIKLGRQIIRQQNIDCIISVGSPFTSHWIAHQLKSQFSNISWHMDIQDPFCYADESRINNHEKYHDKNKEAERRCFENASSISVPYIKSLERYSEIFPESIHKVSVIPPVFIKPQKANIDVELESNKIHLAYFGSFYEGIRSPLPLLELLNYIRIRNAELYQSIKVHMIGQQSPYSLQQFEKYPLVRDDLAFHGFLQRDKTMQLVQKMDYLINFGNTTDYHLPSRVVEYLYFNKPTINFCQIKADSFSLFLGDDIPLLNMYKEQGLAEQCDKLKGFLSTSFTVNGPQKSQIEQYLPQKIAAEYLKVLLDKQN